MGCDIHLYIEKLQSVGGEMRWFCIDKFKIDPYEDKVSFEHVPAFSDRNYALFTALAGVRDYGHELPVIDQPRGIPDDCSPYVKSVVEELGSDGHSHSHMTISELYYYAERNKTLKYSGMVSPEDAEKIDRGLGTPESWCRATNAEGWVEKSWKVEYNIVGRLCEAIENTYNSERWETNTGKIPESKCDSVRIVFFFDN